MGRFHCHLCGRTQTARHARAAWERHYLTRHYQPPEQEPR